MSLPGPDDVHRFWFGEVTDWAATAKANNERWFLKGHELDAPVRERFGALVEAAGRGECEHWLDTPRGALTLVITLDQFPRHIHRGSGAAFAYDDRARAACDAGIARGHDRTLSPVERSFYYLPFEHAEDLDAQERCVALMEAAREDAGPDLTAFLEESVRYAEMHRDIVARFGRFPHRNELLGREATEEEANWLAEGGQRFGQ